MLILAGGARLELANQTQESDEVSWCSWRLFYEQHDIGGIDYWACRPCRQVLLGQIGLVASKQRQGLGREVVEQLRAQLPGYSWHTTPTNPTSQSFWRRLQQTYAGEYHVFHHGAGCRHIGATL